MLIDIVCDIHEPGSLTQKFGRELPIIIHKLEYYDEIAEQNIKDNGEKSAKDLLNGVYNNNIGYICNARDIRDVRILTASREYLLAVFL